MAKTTRDFVANNAMIDFENMKIIEAPKKKDEPYKIYDLLNELKKWDKVEGMNFSIRLTEEIVPESEEY